MAKQRTYTGHSGQMAVMAELLFRQCNVAVPEVDYGTDVFAFLDEREDAARVQVKTAQGKIYQKEAGYSAQYDIPIKQLRQPEPPLLYYALAVRLEKGWGDFVVISRAELNEFWNGQRKLGTEQKSGYLKLTIRSRPARVVCGEVDLTAYRNAWHVLPPLMPLPMIQ